MIAGPFGSAQELLRRLAACRTGDDVGIVEDWTDELLEAVARKLERMAEDSSWTKDLHGASASQREFAAGAAAVVFNRSAAIVRECKPPAVRRSWRRERPPG